MRALVHMTLIIYFRRLNMRITYQKTKNQVTIKMDVSDFRRLQHMLFAYWGDKKFYPICGEKGQRICKELVDFCSFYFYT